MVLLSIGRPSKQTKVRDKKFQGSIWTSQISPGVPFDYHRLKLWRKMSIKFLVESQWFEQSERALAWWTVRRTCLWRLDLWVLSLLQALCQHARFVYWLKKPAAALDVTRSCYFKQGSSNSHGKIGSQLFSQAWDSDWRWRADGSGLCLLEGSGGQKPKRWSEEVPALSRL